MTLLFFKFYDEPLTWMYSWEVDSYWSTQPSNFYCSYIMPDDTSFVGAACGFFGNGDVVGCRV